MQSKRNRILLNVALSFLTIVTSVFVSINSTKSLLETLNQNIFSKQTLSILVIFGTSINFAITILINFNVYKVLFNLSKIEKSAIELYFDIMLSLLISNTLLLLNTRGVNTDPIILFLLNSLSYLIFIALTFVRGFINKEDKKNLLILCGLLLLFTLVINSFSLITNINSLESLS